MSDKIFGIPVGGAEAPVKVAKAPEKKEAKEAKAAKPA